MKALIIDDEINCREVIRSYLNTYAPAFTTVREAFDVETGIQRIHEFKPDLVFMDIQLNGQTCFEILDRLKNTDFKIIFTTAYDNYAIKAFEHAALHYLLKPIDHISFQEALERFNQLGLPTRRNKIEKVKSLYIKTLNTAYHFTYGEVSHIEADGSYSTVYTAKGDEIYTSKKLSDYKDLLEENFFRVHNSFIVNLIHVRQIDEKDNSVWLNTGHKVPISRRRKNSFKAALGKV